MKRAGRPSTISLRWETWNGVHQTRHRENWLFYLKNSAIGTWYTCMLLKQIIWRACVHCMYSFNKKKCKHKKRPIEILNKLCHLPGGFLLQETELVESEAKFMFFVLSCFIYTLIVEKKNIITKWNMRQDLKLLI